MILTLKNVTNGIKKS